MPTTCGRQLRVAHRVARPEVGADCLYRHFERGSAGSEKALVVAVETIDPEDQPEMVRIGRGEGDISAPDLDEVLDRPRWGGSAETLGDLGQPLEAVGGDLGQEGADVLEMMRRGGVGDAGAAGAAAQRETLDAVLRELLLRRREQCRAQVPVVVAVARRCGRRSRFPPPGSLPGGPACDPAGVLIAHAFPPAGRPAGLATRLGETEALTHTRDLDSVKNHLDIV